jgi:SAM-dependent methyltransferase
MNNNPTCPICSEFEWEKIGVQEYSRDLLNHPYPYARIRFEMLFSTWYPDQDRFSLEFLLCNNCGIVIYSPRPDDNDLAEEDSFFSSHPVASQEFTSHLASDKPRAEALFSYLKPLLPRPTRKAKILDFGGGNGRLLAPFTERGHDCGVVDVNSETLPGVHWYGTSIEDLGPDEKFDLIICSHVMEHLLEPKLLLESLAVRLAPQGIIYIEVPSELRNAVPFEVEPATHINYFADWTIGRLLESAGLEVILVEEGTYITETTKKALAIRGVGRLSSARTLNYSESFQGGPRSRKLLSPSVIDKVLLKSRFPSLTIQELRSRGKKMLGQTPLLWRLASKR